MLCFCFYLFVKCNKWKRLLRLLFFSSLFPWSRIFFFCRSSFGKTTMFSLTRITADKNRREEGHLISLLTLDKMTSRDWQQHLKDELPFVSLSRTAVDVRSGLQMKNFCLFSSRCWGDKNDNMALIIKKCWRVIFRVLCRWFTHDG